METNEKLDRLHELEQIIESNREYHHKLRIEALPEDVKTALDKIDLEFNAKQAEVGKEISELEAEIKQDVLHIGSTVKGTYKMAVWNKARVTWDNKGLEGFMVAHPEIVAFRKEGEPSVTIRKVGKGE